MGGKLPARLDRGFSPSFDRLDNEKNYAWEDKFPLPSCGKGGTLPSLRFDVNHPPASQVRPPRPLKLGRRLMSANPFLAHVIASKQDRVSGLRRRIELAPGKDYLQVTG